MDRDALVTSAKSEIRISNIEKNSKSECSKSDRLHALFPGLPACLELFRISIVGFRYSRVGRDFSRAGAILVQNPNHGYTWGLHRGGDSGDGIARTAGNRG